MKFPIKDIFGGISLIIFGIVSFIFNLVVGLKCMTIIAIMFIFATILDKVAEYKKSKVKLVHK